MVAPRKPALIPYSSPQLRHLAWLATAPQITPAGTSALIAESFAEQVRERLSYWDDNPGRQPAVLVEPPHPRLGIYFERLYECLMAEVLGWELLAKNLPVREAGRTLGEFDFLLRNPATNAVEHHEVAVKFYLGQASSDPQQCLWYGPNARDRLDIKVAHLLERQTLLGTLPQAERVLASQGIDPPQAVRIFMPGYLFYPVVGPQPRSPAPADHLRGHWLCLAEVSSVDSAHWVPLQKPHWLGPWQQFEAPDTSVVRAALDKVRAGVPQLFARVEPAGKQWVEVDRFFVVPDDWPNRAR